MADADQSKQTDAEEKVEVSDNTPAATLREVRSRNKVT
jgi:hypothetical protein